MTQLSVLLFNDFETLDVFGPVEIFGRLLDHYYVSFYSLHGGEITNQHNVSINSKPLSGIRNGTDLLLIPGGPGTRKEVETPLTKGKIQIQSEGAEVYYTETTIQKIDKIPDGLMK